MASRVEILFEGRSLTCLAGERLIDILDEFDEPPLRTECRASHCGACRIRVVSGAKLLAPMGAGERQTLAQLRAHPSERLGCQVVVQEAPGTIVLERTP